MQNQSKKNLLHFSLLLIAALLLLIVIFFIQENKKPENVYRHMQIELQEKEYELNHIMNDFFGDDIRENTAKPHEYFEKNIHSGGLPEFSFFLYEKDSLIYWSNNSVSFETCQPSQIKSTAVYRLNNGWFEIRKIEFADYKLIGLIRILNAFPYQNDYLRNHWYLYNATDRQISLDLEKGDYPLYSVDGEYLFSLDFKEAVPGSEFLNFGLFFLCISIFLLLCEFVRQLYKRLPFYYNHIVSLSFAFIIDILLLRAIIQYFSIPYFLYDTALFSPYLYASSSILPSLGDLVWNGIIASYLLIVLQKDLKKANAFSIYRKWQKYLLALLSSLFMVLAFSFLIFVFRSLIWDASFPMHLNNIIELPFYSYLGLLISLMFISVIIVIFVRMLSILDKLKLSYLAFILIQFFSLFLLASLWRFQASFCNGFYFGFYIFICSLSFFITRHRWLKEIYHALILALSFALFATYILYTLNDYREKEERQLLALKLSQNRDKLLEYKFQSLEADLETDSRLNRLLDSAGRTSAVEPVLYNYLENKYFKAFKSQYVIQYTYCDPYSELSLNAGNILLPCFDYFDEILLNAYQPEESGILYFLDDYIDSKSYLAVIEVADDNQKTPGPRLYIELVSKFVPKVLGYPELLIDKQAINYPELASYSYAIFYNKELYKSVGRYLYNFDEDVYLSENYHQHFFNRKGYSHFYYPVNDNITYVISRKLPGFVDLIAPFSIAFLSIGLLLLIFFLLVDYKYFTIKLSRNFRSRIQASQILLILVSFLIIGVFSIIYLININKNKNYEILSEKAHSVLIELEHKLSDYEDIHSVPEDYLDGILLKFSQVFFSDINLYDLDGNVVSSSRKEIYEEGLISGKINPQSFFQLTSNKKTIFINQEFIGDYKYYCACLPFRNQQNELLAYLVLPYFARQAEINQEISTFIVAFINIYIILIGFTIFLSLFSSAYITKPLILIKEKMSKLRLGGQNEKIEWNKKDEIGSLISEYNRMIDELSESAELLAKSERETAWKEMARQVAHEIKNPLTPMRLNVQYLKRAWDGGAKDWDRRLSEFSNSMIEQIDQLSSIASSFSTFARMPAVKKSAIPLDELIENSGSIFSESIEYSLDKSDLSNPYVMGDRQQLLSVFNNLFKNSLQAAKENEMVKVHIHISNKAQFLFVEFSDNGKGIKESEAERIFNPSFTTKTSGMGLGLAIVKSIIEDMDGQIWFKSAAGKGTSFFIKLPVVDYESIE